MRKNTLIKLLAVFAMCFLIGAALVACGEAEVDTDIKGISSVAFDNDGNLVVTYTDNSTQTVELPEAAACQHFNTVSYDLVEHTQTMAGVKLTVCDDCGWAKLDKNNMDHVWVDGEVVVDPTCTEEGYTTTQYCSICDLPSEKTNVTDPAGHTWGEWEVTVAEGKNLCIDGGSQTRYCEKCDAFETEAVAAKAEEGFDGYHTVETWEKVVDITDVNSTGLVKGLCTVCGEYTDVLTIPAVVEYKDGKEVTNAAYTKEIITAKVHCNDDGVYKYTHTATGLEFVITRKGTSHGLLDAEGKFVPLYSSSEANAGVYSTAVWGDKIKEFVDQAIESCNQPVLAYYICEGTNDAGEQCCGVVDIFAVAGHTFNAEAVKNADVPAECGKAGTDWKKCQYCEAEQAFEIKALEHNYVYADQYADLKAEGNTYYYTGVCTLCGGTDKQYVVDYKEVKTPADCENDGNIAITYKNHKGEERTGSETLAATGHAVLINGEMVELVRGSENQTPDQRKVYYYDDIVDENGEHLIQIFPTTTLGEEPILGYFVCAHTENHAGGATNVLIWVSTDVAYKADAE